MRHAGPLLRRAGSFVAACGLLSSCDSWAPGCVASVVCGTQTLSLRLASSVVVACGLSCTAGMWDLSSPTRDQTRVLCTGRRILYHWTTREVHQTSSYFAVQRVRTLTCLSGDRNRSYWWAF